MDHKAERICLSAPQKPDHAGSETLQHMLDIFAMHVPYNEIWLSKYITDLLSFLLEMPDYTLFTSSDNAVSERDNTVSERAISYMQQRFSSNLTMDQVRARYTPRSPPAWRESTRAPLLWEDIRLLRNRRYKSGRGVSNTPLPDYCLRSNLFCFKTISTMIN